jgi:5-methylcytosine-specific restriction enzyme A
MRIGDLPQQVSAVKGHWNPEFPDRSSDSIGWVEFTPSRDAPFSRSRLRSTVHRQMKHGQGYVLEYVTISLPPTNPGSRPLTSEEKLLHAKSAGALTAVFKLANRPVHARELMQPEQYNDLQNRWDQRGDRARWSEAFPIIEAWEITGWPKARDILGVEAAARRCEMQSQFLKELDDNDRAKLARLDLVPIDLPANGLAARYFIDLAQRDNTDRGLRGDSLALEDRPLYEDYIAIEGATRELRVRMAQRDRHLVKILKRVTPLNCALCSYDPIRRGATQAQACAILDAHHKVPVRAGERLSRVEDLVLLCPTCHREVHQRISSIPQQELHSVCITLVG